MATSSPTRFSPKSEDDILTCIAKYFPDVQTGVLLGRGDDCAVLQFEHPLTVSSDLFLENTHFRKQYFLPEDIGYKSLAVNLSDIAACGAKPVAFTLSLGLPKNIDMEWLDAFFHGMSELALKYNTCLVGGDLSASENIAISITIFGEVLGAGRILLRGGSMPGDNIFIVGQIGLAHVGLDVLEHFGRQAMKEWPNACKAHLRPNLHCNDALVLSRAAFNARPPVLMDVSDGILRDLPRLLGMDGELASSDRHAQLGLGACLSLKEEDLHEEVRKWSHGHHKNPIITALLGGEDYALLGACAPDLIPTFQAAIPDFSVLGIITDDGKITCNDEELISVIGFDHFS